MRLPPVIATHTEEVLREILRFTGPADGTLSRYFRDHPRLGSRERGVVAEAVYGLLKGLIVDREHVYSTIGAGKSIVFSPMVIDKLRVFEFLGIFLGSHEEHVLQEVGHPWVFFWIIPRA